MRIARLLPFLLPLALGATSPLEGLVVPFRQVALSPAVASRVLELHVKEGEAVTAGQPLAELYGKLEELEMRRAKAVLERREFEAKGARKLFDNKVIPEAKALEARIELDLARLNYETAQEQVRLHTLVSPIDGVVVECHLEKGEAVTPDRPVFRILDCSKVYIVCQARAGTLPRLALGRKLTVRLPELAERPALQAEVVLVGPCLDAAGLLRVKLLVADQVPFTLVGQKAIVELPD